MKTATKCLIGSLIILSMSNAYSKDLGESANAYDASCPWAADGKTPNTNKLTCGNHVNMYPNGLMITDENPKGKMVFIKFVEKETDLNSRSGPGSGVVPLNCDFVKVWYTDDNGIVKPTPTFLNALKLNKAKLQKGDVADITKPTTLEMKRLITETTLFDNTEFCEQVNKKECEITLEGPGNNSQPSYCNTGIVLTDTNGVKACELYLDRVENTSTRKKELQMTMLKNEDPKVQYKGSEFDKTLVKSDFTESDFFMGTQFRSGLDVKMSGTKLCNDGKHPIGAPASPLKTGTSGTQTK